MTKRSPASAPPIVYEDMVIFKVAGRWKADVGAEAEAGKRSGSVPVWPTDTFHSHSSETIVNTASFTGFTLR